MDSCQISYVVISLNVFYKMDPSTFLIEQLFLKSTCRIFVKFCAKNNQSNHQLGEIRTLLTLRGARELTTVSDCPNIRVPTTHAPSTGGRMRMHAHGPTQLRASDSKRLLIEF